MINRFDHSWNRLPAHVLWTALWCLMTVALGNIATAHPISLTDAYVYVAEETIRAKIEVYAEDLYLYGLVSPNDEGMLSPEALKAAANKFAPAVVESFQILDVSGNPLPASLQRTRTDALPAIEVTPETLMRYRIVYEVEFLSEEPLEFLTFLKRPLEISTVEKKELPAQFTLHLKQEQSARREQELLLPGEPLTLRFDWDSEPLTSSASAQQWQQWYQQQREEQLGIDDYGRVYSFVYITPYEVRHEIIIPVITLETLLATRLPEGDFLDRQDQERLTSELKSFMYEQGELKINHQSQRPQEIVIRYFGLESRDLANAPPPEKVSRINGRVGIILTYPQPETPQELKLCWRLFNAAIQRVNSVVYAGLDVDTKLFSEGLGRNCTTWTNHGQLQRPDLAAVTDARTPPPQWSISWPAIAFAIIFLIRVCRHYLNGHKRQAKVLTVTGVILTVLLWNYTSHPMGSPFYTHEHLSAQEFQQKTQVLLEQAYSAFDQPTEQDILKQLQQAMATPDLVRTAYLDILDGLQLEGTEGLQAHVLDVNVLQAESVETKSVNRVEDLVSADLTWRMISRVEHWGHQHQRETEYRARVTLRSNWKQWKLAGLAIREANQLKAETKVREAVVDQ